MRSTTFHRFKKYPGLLASCNKIVKESSIPQSNIFHGASLKAMQENDDQAAAPTICAERVNFFSQNMI